MIITPIRSNAGETVVNGTSVDSSTFSGDSFKLENNNSILVPGSETTGGDTPGPDTNLFVENEQQNVPLLLAQEQLNRTAKIIVDNNSSNLSDSYNPVSSRVFEIIRATSRADVASNQFNSSLQELGVAKELVNELVTNLGGLFKTSNPNFRTNQVKNRSKDLLDSISPTNQKSLIYVDVEQLNDAIAAHNNLVMKVDSQTLGKILKNPDFLKINQILQDLRNSIHQEN